MADEELATSPLSSLCIMYRRCVSSNLTRLLAIRFERRRRGSWLLRVLLQSFQRVIKAI